MINEVPGWVCECGTAGRDCQNPECAAFVAAERAAISDNADQVFALLLDMLMVDVDDPCRWCEWPEDESAVDVDIDPRPDEYEFAATHLPGCPLRTLLYKIAQDTKRHELARKAGG